MTTSSGTAATRKKASTHKEAAAKPTSQTDKHRINLYLEPAQLADLEEWRFAHKYPHRVDAIRKLVALGLKGEGPPIGKFRSRYRSATPREREIVNVDFSPEFVDEIEKWRFKYQFAVRHDAILELVRRGLKAKDAK